MNFSKVVVMRNLPDMGTAGVYQVRTQRDTGFNIVVSIIDRGVYAFMGVESEGTSITITPSKDKMKIRLNGESVKDNPVAIANFYEEYTMATKIVDGIDEIVECVTEVLDNLPGESGT